MARAHGYGGTEVRMFQTVEKTFGIAAKRIVTGGRAIATAGATGKTAERRIRIAGGVGVPTQRISRATGDTGVTTEGISNVIKDRVITAEIFGITGD